MCTKKGLPCIVFLYTFLDLLYTHSFVRIPYTGPYCMHPTHTSSPQCPATVCNQPPPYPQLPAHMHNYSLHTSTSTNQSHTSLIPSIQSHSFPVQLSYLTHPFLYRYEPLPLPFTSQCTFGSERINSFNHKMSLALLHL